MSEMEWLRTFANNLQYFMEMHDYSQSELARMAGLEQASISRYLGARQMPGPKALINLANVFGVSLDEFMDFGSIIR